MKYTRSTQALQPARSTESGNFSMPSEGGKRIIGVISPQPRQQLLADSVSSVTSLPVPLVEVIWGITRRGKYANGITLRELDSDLRREFEANNYDFSEFPMDLFAEVRNMEALKVFQSGEEIWIICSKWLPKVETG